MHQRNIRSISVLYGFYICKLIRHVKTWKHVSQANITFVTLRLSVETPYVAYPYQLNLYPTFENKRVFVNIFLIWRSLIRMYKLYFNVAWYGKVTCIRLQDSNHAYWEESSQKWGLWLDVRILVIYARDNRQFEVYLVRH